MEIEFDIEGKKYQAYMEQVETTFQRKIRRSLKVTLSTDLARHDDFMFIIGRLGPLDLAHY